MAKKKKEEIFLGIAISLNPTDVGPGQVITADHPSGEGIRAFRHAALAKEALEERMIGVQKETPEAEWRCLIINATQGKIAAAGLLPPVPKPKSNITWSWRNV